MAKLPRATRMEILDTLKNLLGEGSVILSVDATEKILTGDSKEGIRKIKKYDATIGGIGIYCRKPEYKLPGVYRALTYVDIPLIKRHPEESTRGIIVACGAYLEDLIFRCFHQNLVTKVRMEIEKAPLGALIDHIKGKISSDLFNNLKWFSGRVYNYAKHDFDADHRSDPLGDHYYMLDESIAVYFIVRKLGEELILISGVSEEILVSM